jgi:hypothetical protein
LAPDTEFFIRKAIGWALRDHARTQPEAVRTFLADHAHVLSGFTRREAGKHLGWWADGRPWAPRSPDQSVCEISAFISV